MSSSATIDEPRYVGGPTSEIDVWSGLSFDERRSSGVDL